MSLGIDPKTMFSPACSKPLQSSLIIYTWLVKSDTEVTAEVFSQAVHTGLTASRPHSLAGRLFVAGQMQNCEVWV